MIAKIETPGIHTGIPLEEYHAVDACSSSRLRDLGRSPAYCLHRQSVQSKDTPAKVVGSFVHALLLDPTETDRFTVKDWDGRTKIGKARAAEVAELGLTVISEADYARAHAIAAAVERHPWWQALEDRQHELTALWSEDGVPCKARPDLVATLRGRRILADLKVCREGTQDIYERACLRLWHPQQGAWYARGLRSCGVEVAERWIFAVHPEAPHEATAYRITGGLCAWADETVDGRFAHYVECLVGQSWPVGADEVDVPLPDYLMSDEVDLPDDVDVEDESDDR